MQVFDDDGEILLIESSEFLERWAQSPEKTQNKVFLFRGDVHLLSPKLKFDETGDKVSIQNVIKFIFSNFVETRCNDNIQNCINKRIMDYSENIEKFQFQTHCYLPVKLSWALSQNPNLISGAIRAFYYRTPDDYKNSILKANFSPNDCVVSNVKFTRCLYAQMSSQDFTPDSRAGWDESSNDCDKNVLMNGIKISTGFEIFFSNFSKSTKTTDFVDLKSDPLWDKFLRSFNCTVENEEINNLKFIYQQMFRFRNDHLYDFNVGKILFNLISNVSDHQLEDYKKSLKLEPADDDSWLNITQEELDKILNDKFGSKNQTKSENNENELNVTENIYNTLKQFVYNEDSGIKGAEAPKMEKSKQPIKPDKLNVNENEFTNFLNELNFLVENKIDLSNQVDCDSTDSSDMDEYGDDDDDELQTNGFQPKDHEIKAYMKQMDSELAQTIIGKSFTKCTNVVEDIDSDDDEQDNLAVNALANILESHRAENEVSTSVGPATTLFASMHTRLPDDEDK